MIIQRFGKDALCMNLIVSEVRLVGGLQPSSGRLELNFYGVWGTVCNRKFDNNAAGVVCNMLGYQR